MFNVRLFIAVASVLLMSDANQPEATTRQSRLTNPESEPFIVAALNENEKALSILAGYFDLEDVTGINKALYQVQRELNKLVEGTAGTSESRLGHLMAALGYEWFAYFLPGQCTMNPECDNVSGHVQRATGYMVAAFLKEFTDEKRINGIKDLIKGKVYENGTIPEGVLPQETLKVSKEVYFYIA